MRASPQMDHEGVFSDLSDEEEGESSSCSAFFLTLRFLPPAIVVCRNKVRTRGSKLLLSLGDTESQHSVLEDQSGDDEDVSSSYTYGEYLAFVLLTRSELMREEVGVIRTRSRTKSLVKSTSRYPLRTRNNYSGSDRFFDDQEYEEDEHMSESGSTTATEDLVQEVDEQGEY